MENSSEYNAVDGFINDLYNKMDEGIFQYIELKNFFAKKTDFANILLCLHVILLILKFRHYFYSFGYFDYHLRK